MSKFDFALSSEASWRSGWLAENDVYEFDGSYRVYARKDPRNIRWRDQRKKNPTKDPIERALAVGCLCGPDLGPVPSDNERNPFEIQYRRPIPKRAQEQVEEDEYTAKKADFSAIHVQADPAKKSHRQKLFELFQVDNDARGTITKDHAILLSKFLGVCVDESGPNYKSLKDEVDINTWYRFIYDESNAFDEPENMAPGLSALAGGDSMKKNDLVMYLSLFGDAPLSDDEASKFASVLFGSNGQLSVYQVADCTKGFKPGREFLVENAGIELDAELLDDALETTD